MRHVSCLAIGDGVSGFWYLAPQPAAPPSNPTQLSNRRAPARPTAPPGASSAGAAAVAAAAEVASAAAAAATGEAVADSLDGWEMISGVLGTTDPSGLPGSGASASGTGGPPQPEAIRIIMERLDALGEAGKGRRQG